MESLTREKDKLVLMGTIKPSKDHVLVVGYFKVNSKDKNKANNPPNKKWDKSKSQEESSNSKKKNSQKKKGKGEGSKCTYHGNGFHPDRSWMKKKIDILTQILEKNKISLTGGASKKERGTNFKDQERGHALVAITVIYPSLIIDFGASRYMV